MAWEVLKCSNETVAKIESRAGAVLVARQTDRESL
jgi:hypothetical protein